METQINGKKVMAAGVDKQYGHSIGSKIYLSCVSSRELTPIEIGDIQEKIGYHPLGYGGPNNITCYPREDGYYYLWSCYASCD